MTVEVVWLSLTDVQARGYWDQAILEDLFAGSLYPPLGIDCHHRDSIDAVTGQGAVVVVPASAHRDHVEQLNGELARLSWCLLILTTDEGSYFPVCELDHPNMAVWAQTPRTDRHDHIDRALPVGYPPPTRAGLDGHDGTRSLDWFFAGQITHERRRQCAKQLRKLPDGRLIETERFLEGVEHGEYMAGLAAAKIAPCPAGIITPDSFRAWEALEAGALPVVDRQAGEWEVPDYWTPWFDPPFPQIDTWTEFPALLAELLEGWPDNANRAQVWWQQWKRSLAYAFQQTVSDLSGFYQPPRSEQITVVVPTSVIPSHPSTEVIEATVASVRERLPDAEIVLCIDGLAERHEHRRADYEEYVRRLLWLANHEWRGVLPFLFDSHVHQAAMTKQALRSVITPTILFVEHDTPLVGDIDFDGCARALQRHSLQVIRFYHEQHIHPEHRHLMLDASPKSIAGVPVLRTAQWSQRPHLARTDRYREWLDTYFGEGACSFIEDVMHGVVDVHCREFGQSGWRKFGIGIYHPPGVIARSTHLDGRGEDDKAECVFAYDGDTPFGAPAPHDRGARDG